MPRIQLNETNLRTATDWLCGQDDDLKFVFDTYGYPPLWAREATFSTMLHIILEQQVSLASAHATFFKIEDVYVWQNQATSIPGHR